MWMNRDKASVRSQVSGIGSQPRGGMGLGGELVMRFDPWKGVGAVREPSLPFICPLVRGNREEDFAQPGWLEKSKEFPTGSQRQRTETTERSPRCSLCPLCSSGSADNFPVWSHGQDPNGPGLVGYAKVTSSPREQSTWPVNDRWLCNTFRCRSAPACPR